MVFEVAVCVLGGEGGGGALEYSRSFFFFLLSTSLELKQDIVAALSGNVLLDFYKFFESQKDGYAWHYQGNIIILFFFAILSYSKIE